MPQWDHPETTPYSIYQCERPHEQAQGLTECKLREPLKSPDHIRLLKIYPPGWPHRLAEKLTHAEDGEIRCDVFQVALADVTTLKRPYFATLSYAWGDHGFTRKVCCGKQLVPVTVNLYEALVYVRNLRTPRLLWVDSLCINQTRKREKAHQVQRMHLIYGQSHCITWMGVESGGRDKLESLLPIMKQLSDIERRLSANGTLLTWNNVNDNVQNMPTRQVSSLRQVPWAKLLLFLDRDIFNRLWCVQEILLARSNSIRASTFQIDIAVLTRSTGLVYRVLGDLQITTHNDEIPDKIGTTVQVLGRLKRISSQLFLMLSTLPLPCLKFKKAAGPARPVTTFSIVTEYHGKECSDPRDRIYGLAALCGLGTDYQISYSGRTSLAAQEVFVDFSLHCVRTSMSLEILQALYRSTVLRQTSPVLRQSSQVHLFSSTSHRSWTPELPSWCPDFAGPKPSMRSMLLDDLRREFRLRASKSCPVRLTKSSRQGLGVIGMQLGRISTCSTWWGVESIHGQSTSWQYLASLRRCISCLESSIPAQLLCKLLLDVCSSGLDWRECAAWAKVTYELPADTKDRMVRSSLGAAWIINHLPDLASRAKLMLHRSLAPRQWRDVVNDVDTWLFDINLGTRLFTTDNADAAIGSGPEGLHTGDIVCVLYGGDVPFILRPDNQGQYTLIGECYVSGIMKGEALDMGLDEREFLLK